MPSDEQQIADWVNFPDGIPTLSLWDALHDGDLLSIESDLLARTVTLRFDVGYVRDFHRQSEQTRFIIVVDGVRSVRSFRSVPWPGGCSIPQGMLRGQQETLIAEYHRKWREESLSWSDFEALVNDGLEVSIATLGRGPDVVALQRVCWWPTTLTSKRTFGEKGLRSTSGKGKSRPKSLSHLARHTGTHLRRKRKAD